MVVTARGGRAPALHAVRRARRGRGTARRLAARASLAARGQAAGEAARAGPCRGRV